MAATVVKTRHTVTHKIFIQPGLDVGQNPTLALSPPEPKQSEGHQAVGDAIHQYQICNIPHLYLKSIESPICNGEHHESFTWPKPYNGCDPCSRASSMWPSATFLHIWSRQKFILKRNQKLLFTLESPHIKKPLSRPYNCVMQQMILLYYYF